MCRDPQLTSQIIDSWKQRFLAAATEAFESDAIHNAEQERIVELERMIGKLTMELEIARKTLSLLTGMQDRNGRQW